MNPEINYKKKTEKIHKCVETKQHATEQPIGQRRYQKKSQKQLQ